MAVGMAANGSLQMARAPAPGQLRKQYADTSYQYGLAGAAPELPLTTSTMGQVMAVSALFDPEASAATAWAAIAWMGWLAVVRGGEDRRAASLSSKPAIEGASGITRPLA
jgi:hypothetical protein